MDKILYESNKFSGEYNFCFAYPERESFALSSLGYLWLFMLTDSMKGINCARVDTDNPVSPFKRTDAIAFSMSFDFDFIGVFDILKKNNIPFKIADRSEESPLVFAGGPVITTNPIPYKNIFDFMLIGDGEGVIKDVLRIISRKQRKSETLEELSKLDGVYVPLLSSKVKKNIENPDNVIYTPIISDRSYFKDTFILELQRGCMNRCAFCTASYLNLPFRSNSYDKIIKTIDLGLKYTNKIALLGAQISAHPDFDKIIKYIEDKIDSGEKTELGISSLRVDSISPQLIKTLVKGGQKTSTIAIEAATERLRKLINKNLKEPDILEAIKISRENGLKGLKIYSMIGIPGETDEDIKEFILLGKKIKDLNKGFKIEFSFSTFVPKPHTPMQWEKREETKSLEKKQKFLEKEFSKIGILSKFSSAKWDYWQALLSRGDETLSDFMINVYESGGKISAYKSAGKLLSKRTMRAIEGYACDDALPWDLIDSGIPKNRLMAEAKRLGLQNFSS